MTEHEIRRALRDVPCWDRQTEQIFQDRGEPVQDVALQSREELVALCQWIDRARIRSYLEIGLWTGRLVSALHRLFQFDLVAACDHRWAERFGLSIHLPPDCRVFWGDSRSAGYQRWRRELGVVDLVLIDADHRYGAVRQDFQINRSFPHRFLAFHDITGARRQTRGVGRLWSELTEGYRLELLRPHPEVGLEHSAMGIGLWSATEDPRRFAGGDPQESR